MTHWKLTLAYDGTPFNGWQVQPGLPTVQGVLSDAIHRTVGERLLPQGSGRTDTGVHALGQVASFSLNAPIPASNFHRALNRCLPNSIRVLSVEAVPPGFHARHSAIGKTYEYRIFPLRPSGVEPRTATLEPDRICPPTLAPYVWPCPWPLDLEALNHAARHVLGTHDFTTFAATDPDLTSRQSATSISTPPNPSEELPGSPQTLTMGALGGAEKSGVSMESGEQRVPGAKARIDCAPVMPGLKSRPILETSFSAAASAPGACSSAELRSSIRTITHSHWSVEDSLILYRVRANGFLHHMVRNLVGTFVQAGAHRLDPDSIPTLLAARDRSAAGPTAPACGLFLVKVEYPPLEPNR